jgi:cytochrome c peroxidase
MRAARIDISAGFIAASLVVPFGWATQVPPASPTPGTTPSAETPAREAIVRDALPPTIAALDDDAIRRIARMAQRVPAPPDPTNRFADSDAAAEFGRALFFEPRLSPKSVSCAHCHDPKQWFTDGKALAAGIGTTRRNAPTVVDAARRRWIGWDGKFDSLWSQALAPIEHPDEMGGDRRGMLRLIRDDTALRSGFERAFGAFPESLVSRPSGDPLAPPPDHVGGSTPEIDRATVLALKAMGAYQRRLQSGPTRVDEFSDAVRTAGRQGSFAALSIEELRGLAIFVGSGGCFQCHRGANFTDEEFHSIGLPGANGRVPDDPARLAAVDFLKSNPFNAAGVFSDAAESTKASLVQGLRRSGELFGQFRTPPLRGVALTAPYMHDGRMSTLEDVVRFYDTLEGASPVGHHGEMVLQPLGLAEQGRADLVAFLRALTPKSTDLGDWANPPAQPARTNHD